MRKAGAGKEGTVVVVFNGIIASLVFGIMNFILGVSQLS